MKKIRSESSKKPNKCCEAISPFLVWKIYTCHSVDGMTQGTQKVNSLSHLSMQDIIISVMMMLGTKS